MSCDMLSPVFVRHLPTYFSTPFPNFVRQPSASCNTSFPQCRPPSSLALQQAFLQFVRHFHSYCNRPLPSLVRHLPWSCNALFSSLVRHLPSSCNTRFPVWFAIFPRPAIRLSRVRPPSSPVMHYAFPQFCPPYLLVLQDPFFPISSAIFHRPAIRRFRPPFSATILYIGILLYLIQIAGHPWDIPPPTVGKRLVLLVGRAPTLLFGGRFSDSSCRRLRPPTLIH